MKTYQTEQLFVTNFAKDVKTESHFEVNGKQFTATYVGKNSGMQAVYKVTLDGVTKDINISQLKKRLGVTYTREQNRTGEVKTATKFVAKTEEELLATANTIVTSVFDAFAKALKICNKYGLTCDEMHALFKADAKGRAAEIAFDVLRDRQNAVLQAKAAEAAKAAAEKAELEAQLDAAVAAKDYKEIGRISALLAKY